jgi:hypothetical protein
MYVKEPRPLWFYSIQIASCDLATKAVTKYHTQWSGPFWCLSIKNIPVYLRV